MKKNLLIPTLMLSLSSFASCGNGDITEITQPSDDINAGIVEPTELKLVGGEYHGKLKFYVRTDSNGFTSTDGEAYFQVVESNVILAKSSNSRFCYITQGSPGLSTPSDYDDLLSAGELALNQNQVVEPDEENYYKLDNSVVDTGSTFRLAFKGATQSFEQDEILIPDFFLDLFVPEPGDLLLQGEVPQGDISLDQVPQLTWQPVGNLYESSEEKLSYAGQIVTVIAKDGQGKNLGSLTCSLYPTESSLAAVLEDEGIDVQQVISDLDGQSHSVIFQIEQNYHLGALLENKGGFSAEVVRLKSFRLGAD